MRDIGNVYPHSKGYFCKSEDFRKTSIALVLRMPSRSAPCAWAPDGVSNRFVALLIFLLGTVQFLHLLCRQGAGSSKLVGGKSYLCKMLDRFHLHKRFEKRRSVAYGAVVGQQNRVMPGKIGPQARRYLLCSRRRVLG